MKLPGKFPIVAALLLSGCSAPPALPEGPVARTLALAADEAGVPRALVTAVAIEEGGLRLAPRRIFDESDHVPVAGHLELRRGAFDSLARGAALAGVDASVLVEDTALATRAGAAVLAELGRETGASDELSSWAPALEALSGFSDAGQRRAYAQRVLGRTVDGGRFRAFAGEIVALEAHGALDPALAIGVAVQALSAAQFPGASVIPTSCAGKCNVGRGSNTIDTIVIHDTEGGWNASVATLQNDSGKSVHYIIDEDGSRVGQFRSEDDITWHCGNSVYNGRSVGIEHVGYFDDPDGFSSALYDTSVALVKSIRSRHGSIPLDRAHVIGHYQVPDGGQISSSAPACADPLMSCLGSTKYGGASNHRDPGPKWQWCQYMKKLGGSCRCADAFSHFNCTTDKTEAVRCVGGTVEIVECGAPCVVMPIGEDDLCLPAAKPGPRDFRAELAEGVLRELPVTPLEGPGDPAASPGDAPPLEEGCAFVGARPAAPAWALLLLLGLVTLSRRRARAR